MGWANCGTDSIGRPIGYAHDGTCDHPGCDAPIHRGLSYKCGLMHGSDVDHCEGYFCPEHLRTPYDEDGEPMTDGQRCVTCAHLIETTPPGEDWPDHPDAWPAGVARTPEGEPHA